MSTDRAAEVRQRYAALLDEIRRDEEWQDDLRTSPYAPARFAHELAALGADAVPVAIEGLAQPDAAIARWAAFVLAYIGPPAAAAVEPLRACMAAHRGETAEAAAAALFRVDPDAGRRAGALRDPAVIERIIRQHLRGDPPALGHFFAERMADGDEAVLPKVLLTLSGASLEYLLDDLDAFAPHDALRALVADPRPEIQRAATICLAELADPSDTERLLGLADRPAPRALIVRIASHPRSLDFVPALGAQGEATDALLQLVRRRRAAGHATPAALLHDLLTADLASEPPPGGSNRAWRIGYAALTAAELGDPALIPAIEQARARHGSVYPVDAWCREALATPGASDAADLARADELFAAGRIDVDEDTAFARYARRLRLVPRCAHSAFQLAWIDRAFGGTPDAGRIAWIRDLGFRDEALLALLAAPLDRPLRGMRGSWSKDAMHAGPALARACRAEQAGLYGLAHTLARGGRDRQLAAQSQEALAAHLARIRAATA